MAVLVPKEKGSKKSDADVIAEMSVCITSGVFSTLDNAEQAEAEIRTWCEEHRFSLAQMSTGAYVQEYREGWRGERFRALVVPGRGRRITMVEG